MPEKTNDLPAVDVVLWGASGFVGRLVAEYLWPRYGATDEVRLALGGKSRARLEALHRDLGGDQRLAVTVGDARDTGFLAEMARKARVVVSTVGPYSRLGSPLVAACAAAGTDYCDLSGEVPWMRRMIDAHQQDAEASGARMVPACGFDSIPSDLGVLFLQNEALRRFGRPLQRVKMRVKAMRGGASGGTVASLIHVIEEARRDPLVARVAKNPYGLAPRGMRRGVRQPDVILWEYDPDAGSWIAPFILGAANTRVVHRSHALLGHSWGKDFRYDEAVMMGGGVWGRIRAASFAVTLGAFVLGSAFWPTRAFLQKTILPAPGQGPSAEKREKGFFKLAFLGQTADGRRLGAVVTGDRDPGYGSTAKMLGEAAVCLLKDIPPSDVKGGFWTPATAMGQALMERLSARAGVTFEIAG